MLKFALDLKAKAGACRPEVSHKKRKSEVFGGKWSLVGNILQFSFKRIHDDTNSCFVFKFFTKIGRQEVGEMK